MKTISTSFAWLHNQVTSRFNAHVAYATARCFFIGLALMSSIHASAQTTATEDFENETTTSGTASHTFSESGISFSTDLMFQKSSSGFGYNASTSYIQVNGNTVTKTITIQNASTSFKINSFAAYVATSTNGNNATNGAITFVGTLVGGSTVTATVNVASTGTVPSGQTREANQMVNGLNFVGTPLDGIYMTSLSVSTSATVLYAQLDHISFTTQAVVTNQFSINDVSQNEGNSGTSNFTFTITRSSNTATSSVQVQSSNATATSGTDYTAFPLTTLNFTAGGALTQTVNVVVNGDVTVEPNETFTMTLSNPSGGVLLGATGIGTIVDDDAINEPFDDETHQTSTFSQSGNSFQTTGKLIVKNAGNFGQGGTSGYASSIEPFAVGNQGSLQIISPGKSFNAISVDLWSAAVSGSAPNYTFTATNCIITFTGTKADGSGTVTHTASITPSGTNVHATVSFAGSPLANIQLSAISFSTPTGIQYLQIDNFKYGTATLTNTQLSIDDVSVIEGTGAGTTTATFTVTRTNNTTSFTVNVASSDGTATAGSDYTAFPSTTLTFTSGGALTQTVNVTALKDATIEPNETFNMTLSGATNGTLYLKQVGIGTILNDDSVVETFEDETNNALTFSQNSVNFSTSGGFKVKQASTFGSGSSTFYLTSSNNAVGNQGTFSITSPNKAFKLNFLDAWVGTSVTAFSSGSVTFTGTLFGGGTVTTTKTITATAATGAGWQQNISFVGTPLDNVLLTAIQVSTGGSLTLCEIDNFNHTIVNTLPIIEVVDASNVAIFNGGAAATGNNTDFGTVTCQASPVSRIYTIKNLGLTNLTLSGSPLAVLGGADAAQFRITTQPTSPIAANGSVTFTVRYTPTTIGTHNAIITLTSNDATNTPYIINIKGTGAGNGDPSVFGSNIWRVYAWNAGGANINANSWTTNYSGFYTNSNLNFNTTDNWINTTSPSSAVATANTTAYQGCTVGVDNHSWSAKRQGFPCGYYQLNVPTHDDGVQLWVNNIKVFEHDACCDAHTNVWTGFLGTTDKVEFRVTEGTGGSEGSLTLTAFTSSVAIAITTGSQTSCPNASVTFTATPTNGGTTPMYQWKNGGVNISGATNATYTTTTLATGDIIMCDMTTPCVTVPSASITMIVTNTWTGTTSTDWSTPSNWSCGSVPTSTMSVTVPTTTNAPTLSSSQTVDNLTLTGTNRITLGNNTLIANGITGGGSSNYVVTNGTTGGLTVKNVSVTPTLFPVGSSSTVYAPATVTNNATARDFTVKVGTTISNPSGLNNIVNLQWDVTPSVSTGNSATLALGWSAAQQSVGFNPAGAVNIAHNNGTTWDYFLATTVTGTNPYTATATGVTAFSPFVVTNQAVLSVELLDFKATPSVSGNILTWITANEINNKGFEVERLNPITNQWIPLGFVKSKGKTGLYDFMDKDPLSISFYRLRQIDNDGKETLSKVVSIQTKGAKGKLAVYPNPVSNLLTIEAPDKNLDYIITNLLGQMILRGSVNASTIDVSALPKGGYLLKIGAEQVKFVKQ